MVPEGFLRPGINGVFNPILSNPLPLNPPTLIFPQLYNPPRASDTPDALFAAGARTLLRSTPHERFISRSNPDQIILWTDGACLNNGQEGATAGYAVKHRPSTDPEESTFSSRLEDQGPDGETYTPTSNRAELELSLPLCSSVVDKEKDERA